MREKKIKEKYDGKFTKYCQLRRYKLFVYMIFSVHFNCIFNFIELL